MATTKTKPVGRTPTKRRDCEVWLLRQLAVSPRLARDILVLGSDSGWGWATVRRAKASVGVQSMRTGDEWWWFDPRTFDPQTDTLPPKRMDLSQREVAAPASLDAPETTPGISVPPSQSRPQAAMVPAPLPIAAPLPAIAPQNRPETASSLVQEGVAPLPSPKPVSPAAVLPAASSEPRKPPAPAKPRPFHIWDGAHRETRESLISAAGFADLYNMSLDIRFRQEQLRTKGLLNEAAALDELLARVNDALKRKKRAESVE